MLGSADLYWTWIGVGGWVVTPALSDLSLSFCSAMSTSLLAAFQGDQLRALQADELIRLVRSKRARC